MGRVFALRNVRIFYKKYGRMIFASHLDMYRLMSRLLRLSSVPVWYTEGFNRHPYLTFALPLSLGFTSDYEILDIKITDDDYTDDMLKSALESVFPEGLEVISVSECVEKTGKIAFAEFNITFENKDEYFAKNLTEFLMGDSIVTQKKTKKGTMKEIDLAPFIKRFSVTTEDNIVLNIVLSAGGENNINPTLLLNAYGELPDYSVCRSMIYNADMQIFK